MKHKLSLITLAAAVALTGCNQEKPAATDQPVTGQDVKDQYKDAFKTTKEYAGQTKDEFVASMDAKMRDLDARIKALADKSADYKDDAKAEADKALADLHTQREALAKKFDELKQATQDAWEKTRAGFISAWESLTNALENAAAKFK